MLEYFRANVLKSEYEEESFISGGGVRTPYNLPLDPPLRIFGRTLLRNLQKEHETA